LKDSFVAFSRDQATERELVNTIIRSMGYAVDANFESEYEEGLLFTAHQILAELGEKVKGDTRNGMSSLGGLRPDTRTFLPGPHCHQFSNFAVGNHRIRAMAAFSQILLKNSKSQINRLRLARWH